MVRLYEIEHAHPEVCGREGREMRRMGMRQEDRHSS